MRYTYFISQINLKKKMTAASYCRLSIWELEKHRENDHSKLFYDEKEKWLHNMKMPRNEDRRVIFLPYTQHRVWFDY